MKGNPDRSHESITPSDLRRLARIARSDRTDFFERFPRWSKLYSGRFLCAALCQGAASHFVNGKTGVKDFDVWSFFCEISGQPMRRRRVVSRDFGHPKFGTSPDRPDFVGRRVDLVFRSIDCNHGTSPITALRQYLTEGRTATARFLAGKGAVLIEPAEFAGAIAWLKRRDP
jgi:hypothetical protein